MSGFAVDLSLRRRTHSGESFRLEVAFRSGEGITVVFGPSGSGKTSLLLAILGALRPDRGTISVEGVPLFDSDSGIDLPIRRRRIGIVFQDALLFPHLSVRGNVRFGGGPSAERWLKSVGALELAERMPTELSGGQRQRVALARALAARPSALLLDEPFSALDLPARESLGEKLLQLQAESGVPFLHVTHDIGEALRMGNRLVVLDRGRVVQSGPPSEVVARPAAAAAARAVGTENLFTGTIVSHHPERGYSEVDLGGVRVQTALLEKPEGGRVALGLRAEDILLSLQALHETSARNVLAGSVSRLESRGAAIELAVDTPVRFRVLVTPAAVHELGLAIGSEVHLLIKASAFHRLV